MSIRLIYHSLEHQTDTISPFDDVIIDMVGGQAIQVVCPYLGLEYLTRITHLSASWRVLTDVEAWLKLHEATARAAIQQFIEEHQQAIHHIRDLHAKVVLAGHKALVGSANLTNKGITGRAEMAVLFEDEPSVIDELRQWFETLWLRSAPVELGDLHTYSDALPSPSAASLQTTTRLPSRVAPICASLKPMPGNTLPMIAQYPESHWLLVDRVKQVSDRKWINCYFDLVKRVIDATELTNDDPRLVTSIRKEPVLFPISINNRWVLSSHKKNGEWYIRIIYGYEFEFLPKLQAQVSHHSRFRSLSGEGVNTPFLLSFKDIGALLDGEWDVGWLHAAKAEVIRAKASPYRKYHQSVVYEAAVNLDYRTRVLNTAFHER